MGGYRFCFGSGRYTYIIKGDGNDIYEVDADNAKQAYARIKKGCMVSKEELSISERIDKR